jgi:hypothetical protein
MTIASETGRVKRFGHLTGGVTAACRRHDDGATRPICQDN